MWHGRRMEHRLISCWPFEAIARPSIRHYFGLEQLVERIRLQNNQAMSLADICRTWCIYQRIRGKDAGSIVRHPCTATPSFIDAASTKGLCLKSVA